MYIILNTIEFLNIFPLHDFTRYKITFSGKFKNIFYIFNSIFLTKYISEVF